MPKISNYLFLFSPFPSISPLETDIMNARRKAKESLAKVETHVCKLPGALTFQRCVSVGHIREVFGLPAHGRVQVM